jgi:trans-aconitate methyltransferase
VVSTAKTELLDGIAERYDPTDAATEFDYWLKRLQADAVEPWVRGAAALELGCATGELTALLAPRCAAYDVVEGSARNIAAARQRVPGARYHHSLWEDFVPDGRYSDVIAFNALEHVEDPVGLLRSAGAWLEPGGRIHVAVPNALSLHRLIGVEMGLQPDPVSLTEADRAQGHHRNYTIDALLADLCAAGLHVLHWEGVFLKLLPNRQMVGWDPALITAIGRVGRRFGANGASLLAIASAAG